MKLTICKTQNGWLIVNGSIKTTTLNGETELPERCWTFNSLGKAIAQIRAMMKSWHSEPKPE
jgi:hypothetical protein